MQWCRLYASMRHDPKVLALSDELHRALINIWTIATETDGKLPSFPVLSFELRMRSDKVRRVINDLISAGFIDRIDEHLEVHGWNKRQYKSDTSRERTKRWRNKASDEAVTSQEASQETSPKRPQIQIQTQKERKKERFLVHAAKNAHAPSECFDRFWKAYPKRLGPNPKKPALKAFEREVQRGFDPEVIIKGAQRFAAEERKAGRERTPYVCQAVTWLNQNRWGDYQPAQQVNGHAAKRERTPEEIAIDEDMARRGAELLDEFGNLKPF